MDQLLAACRAAGATNDVKEIVESGAVDINSTEEYGYTPLHRAMVYNYPSIVSILLAQDTTRIDVVSTKYNTTPLHLACGAGALDCVKLYTQDPRCTMEILNIKDSLCGWTALMAAVRSGHLDVVKYLATVKGVDFDTKDGEGRTVVKVARERNRVDIRDFLEERKKYNEAEANVRVTPEVEKKLTKSQKKNRRRRNKKSDIMDNMAEGNFPSNNNLMEASGNDDEGVEKEASENDDEGVEKEASVNDNEGKKRKEKVQKVLDRDHEALSNKVDGVREMIDPISKYLKNEKVKLETKFSQLILHIKTAKQSVQVMSANCKEMTEKLRNKKIEDENNKQEIEKVNVDIEEVEAQLRVLKLKKSDLLEKEKSIQKKIIQLEAGKETLKSVLDKETVAIELMETKLSTGLGKLEEELKSGDGKMKDPKDCPVPVPGPPPCPECPICFENMVPPMKIIQCKEGHHICEKCRNHPEMKRCPKCKAKFIGRARDMEGLMREWFRCE